MLEVSWLTYQSVVEVSEILWLFEQVVAYKDICVFLKGVLLVVG